MAFKIQLVAVASLISLAACNSNHSSNTTAAHDTVKRKPITQSTAPGSDNGSTNQNGAVNQSAPANASPNTPSAPAPAQSGTSGN